MKKNVKRLLLGVLVGAMSVFAVVASGCSAKDKVEGWFEQLSCEHKNTKVVAELAPTCTEDGHAEYVECIDCGKATVKKVVIKAMGHTTKTIKGYAATCTKMGLTDGAKCTVCKETVKEQKQIAALGHKKIEVKEEKATCITDGHTAGVICANGCGTVYEGYEIIPATGHDFGENGDCENCGESSTISFADVEVGMDLSGYAIRLSVSEEEFLSFIDTYQGKSSADEGVIFFNTETYDYLISFCENGLEVFIRDPRTCEVVISWSGGTVEYLTPLYVLGEEFLEVYNINYAEPFDYFEFYYVGLPETNEATPAATNDVETTAVAYSMNEHAVVADSSIEEFDFGTLSTVVDDDEEWTAIY